jgi:hypothetical protein
MGVLLGFPLAVDYDALCRKIDGELIKQDTHAEIAAPESRASMTVATSETMKDCSDRGRGQRTAEHEHRGAGEQANRDEASRTERARHEAIHVRTSLLALRRSSRGGRGGSYERQPNLKGS